LVLALSLVVSPLGAVVCVVACAVDDVAPDQDVHRAPEHLGTPVSVVSTIDADHDHDCPHPEAAPAVLTSVSLGLLDRAAADLPSTVVFSPMPPIVRTLIATLVWSPPHVGPPALPLRI
jgi:hypothetical protein